MILTDKVKIGQEVANSAPTPVTPTDDSKEVVNVEYLHGKLADAGGGTSAEGSLSTVYITTSNYGAVSDADISLGSTSFGTDNLAILQEILDKAQTKPLVVLWDGKYSISGALTIYSNTTIIGANGAGVILRDHSNSPVFKNANRVLPSATNGYGSNIIDENIRIENLIINGNGYNTGPTGSDVFDTANGGSSVNGSAQTKQIPMIDFLGAKEVYLDNIKLWAGRYWSTSLCNVEQVHCTNLDIDFGLSSTRDDKNYDGLHFNGYARWISCDGLRIKGGNDDALALNADASDFPEYTGPITDADFSNFYFYDTTRGIRLLSTVSRIDRISFTNFKGYVGDLFCLIQAYPASATSNFGSLYFNDIDVELFDSADYDINTYFYLDNVKIDSLNINNIVRKDYNNAAPYIKIMGGTNTNIKHINISNVREIVPASKAYSQPFISVLSGTIFSLSVDDVKRSTSGGNFNSDLVKVSGGNIEYLTVSRYDHKEENTGASANVISIIAGDVSHARLDRVALSGLPRMLNHAGGALDRIEANMVTMTGGGITEMFYTFGTVNYLVVSGLSFWDGAKLTTGTFSRKIGDGFIWRPTTKNLLPLPTQFQSCALVTDADGGPVPAFSDGANWRSVIDNTPFIISSSSIISYWELEADASDSVGANNGTSDNVTYVTGGKVANMLKLVQSSLSRVYIPSPDNLSFGDGATDSPFSIVFWVKFDADNNGDIASQLVGKRADNNTAKEYHVYFDNPAISPTLTFRLFDQSSGGQLNINHGWTPVADTWYHIAATYDGNGSTSGMKLYLNGVSVGSAATSGTYTAMENNSGNFYIGPQATAGGNIAGNMDEVAVFDKELTSIEVNDIITKNNSGQKLNS